MNLWYENLIFSIVLLFFFFNFFIFFYFFWKKTKNGIFEKPLEPLLPSLSVTTFNETKGIQNFNIPVDVFPVKIFESLTELQPHNRKNVQNLSIYADPVCSELPLWQYVTTGGKPSTCFCRGDSWSRISEARIFKKNEISILVISFVCFFIHVFSYKINCLI